MKELTIELKARKYDEALERARKVLLDCTPEEQKVVEYISPELKESEDEKIKRRIIEWVIQCKTEISDEERIKEYDSWIAWLEKTYTQKDLADAYLKGLEDAKSTEIKTDPCKDCADRAANCHNFPCDRKKKFDEQKSAEKVEPKFHKGDFITDGERIFQIKETVWERNNRNDGITYCESLIVNLKDGITYANDTNLKEYHIWTIQDAKDGDILVDKSDGTIGIFQSIGHHPDGGSYNNPSYCFLHCRYDDGYFYADFENGNTMSSDDAIPATKEQRDTLFKAMADAGWEFDFNKKELKKIECNPDDLIKESYHQQADDSIDMVTEKSAWSEEDEERIKNILSVLDAQMCWNGATGKKENPYQKEIDWLKSLKDRVQPQPKQEWSEEDEKTLNSILVCIEYCKDEDTEAQYNGNHNVDPERYEPMSTWLKSLKDRVGCEINCTTTKEWSEEEQMLNVIKSDVLRIRQKCGIGTDEWNIRLKVLNWLKSLKERVHSKNNWKPSEEQMITLRHVISGCSYDIEPLVELETKLKEL